MIRLVKYNYFEDLEKLSVLSLSAVSLAGGIVCKDSISEIRKECDGIVCNTEDALFSDFLPPLERENIAATAHCLSRIVERAAELSADPYATPAFMKQNEEAEVCIKLAEELKKDIFLLRRIKRPEESPNTCGYRTLLSEGRCAHRRMLAKVRSGALSKKYAEAIILTGKLRSELSRAFDELIEIMLCNI